MKTSIFIIVALLLNTTLLVAEPLATLVRGINLWVLVAIESILVIGFLLNFWLKALNKACTIDLGHLDVFVFKSQKK